LDEYKRTKDVAHLSRVATAMTVAAKEDADELMDLMHDAASLETGEGGLFVYGRVADSQRL
jgi:hypothetical protein